MCTGVCKLMALVPVEHRHKVMCVVQAQGHPALQSNPYDVFDELQASTEERDSASNVKRNTVGHVYDTFDVLLSDHLTTFQRMDIQVPSSIAVCGSLFAAAEAREYLYRYVHHSLSLLWCCCHLVIYVFMLQVKCRLIR